MTKDDAIDRAYSLLCTVLAASEQGLCPHETRNRHENKMLSDYIGDFLREMQNEFDEPEEE